MAGVALVAMALDDILLRFTWPAWQAWHLPTSTFVSPGMWHLRHWDGSGGAWSPLVARDAAPLCVAGVALANILLRSAWQAWRFWHWSGSGGALGRHGTWLTTTFVFAWQPWHLATSTCIWRGRRGACGTGLALVARLVAVIVAWGAVGRGTCSHPLSFCVAGVALGDIYLHLAWQAWHVWHWAGSGGAFGRR